MFDKYIKTIINLSFWVVIKSALDPVVYEYLVGVHGSSGFEMIVAMYSHGLLPVMVLTIPSFYLLLVGLICRQRLQEMRLGFTSNIRKGY